MPGERERERTETGQYVEEISLEDVLATFGAVEGPAITSSDVSERLECTPEAARQKLTRLVDQGRVLARKSGRTTLYWRADGSDTAAAAPASASTPQTPRSEAQRPASSPETDPDAAEDAIDDMMDLDSAPSGRTVQDVVDDVSSSWDDDDRLEHRREAARHVLEHAVDTEEYIGKSSDAVQEARERYPVEGQNAETYWRKNVRPVLKEVGEYSKGKHGYRVTGLAKQ